MAGVIIGAIALLLGGIALAKSSKAATEEALTAQVGRIDEATKSASDAAVKADRANTNVKALQDSMQGAFNEVSKSLSLMTTEIQELKAAKAAKPVANSNASTATAGKDEYIVKAGDVSGTKIAAANGVKLSDLMAVNPGVEWNKLKIGQKLKLPAKK